jgi:hypothetical protein
MKKSIILVSIAAALLSGWYVYSRVAQSRRDAAYQAALAPYTRDLLPGTERNDVKKYLDSRNVMYNRLKVGGDESDRFQIQIGEDPGSFFCEEWRVYIVLEFSAADRLKDAHVTKWATCL